MSGQENPGQGFDRKAAGFRAYMLDGSIIRVDNQADAQFKNQWNQLDHANLISVVLFQKQRFEAFEEDNVARFKHYRILIHTNTESEDATRYWMDDDTLLIFEGFAADEAQHPNAHGYPMVIRDYTITEAQQILAFDDVVWT